MDKRNLSPAMAKLADEIVANGIDADEVLRLRREIFHDGVVDRDEAKLLFHLNEQTGAGNDQAWYDFFVEALTDYFVWKQEPFGYLSDEDTDFLIEQISHDGKVDDRTEFGLLVNIIHRLRLGPEKLVDFALQAVKETVLGGGTVVFGPERRRPGVIDPADVDIIRTIVFGTGGDGSLTVSKREAELVFELNNQTTEKENAPEWRKLFVQAIANYLMFPSGAPAVPDRAEAVRRERWLEERRGIGAFVADMGKVNARNFASTTRGILGRGPDAGAAADAMAEASAFARESISATEAAWLTEQISRDGILHDNERALLVFIKENAPRIDPSLDPLFEQAGLAG